MGNSQLMKGKPFLAIVIAVAVLLIICIVLFMSGFFLESRNYENREVVENMTLEELNKALTAEIDQMKMRGGLVTRREINEEQKVITLYEIHMDEDQIDELQGRIIGGWKVIVLPDIDYLNEMEIVRAEIMEMKKNPELQISGSSMTSGDNIKDIEIWVSNRTPENEALDGKVIHGWTIHIYTSPTPPNEEK